MRTSLSAPPAFSMPRLALLYSGRVHPFRNFLPLLITTLILGAGCSGSELLTRDDYADSHYALAEGDVEEALKRYPSGEEGAFITTMERAYLHLLRGEPDIDALRYYADLIEDRFRVVVSREVKSLFYVDTPEGYYASEHEVIWLHMLLSWGYSLRRQYEKGCVEARQASHLLTARWSEEGHFDDPTLRAILGVLWAWCGSWEDAAVDFRVAAELDPALTWARELSQRETPPRNLFLVLGGVGPTPYWDADLQLNPMRGLRNLGFEMQGQRNDLSIGLGTGAAPLHLTPGAAPWYLRHLVRDNAIQELIGDSQYGAESVYEVGRYTVQQGAAIAVWTVITLGGVVLGAGIIYIAIQAGGDSSGDLAGVGVGIMLAGYGMGKAVYNDMTRGSGRRLEQRTDPSYYYRFVRFLPEYAWIGWSDERLGDEVDMALGTPPYRDKKVPLHSVGGTVNKVFLGHLPDNEKLLRE